jgi:dipeptidyl aminopeptidase/acylaminoacyl peptidase
MIPTPAVKLASDSITSLSNPAYRPLDIDTLYYTRSIYTLRWSIDGEHLYFETNITGRYNIWRVPSAGGWPVQLTVSDERTNLADPSPDGHYLLYAQDYQGDEKPNLYLLDLTEYKTRNITETEKIAHRDIKWSPDSRLLFYAAERDIPGTYPIFQHDVATGTIKKIISSDTGDCEALEPSPDGKKLAFSRTRNYQYSGISVRDMETGGETVLAPIDDRSTSIVGGWTRDNKRVFVTSNANDKGIEAVALLDIKENSEFQWLTLQDWDSQLVDTSPTEDKYAYIVNEAGNLHLFIRDLKGDQEEIPPGHGVVRAARFSPDGKQLAILHGSGDSPHDIWVYDLKARTLKQITYSLVGGLNQDNLVQPHLVVYPAQDQTPISSFLYMPANIKPDRSHPAIVYVHGGPQWQHFNSWYPSIQYHTSHGYIVIAPNYRGSTGYGRDYMESLRKDAGRGDLNDLVAAVDYLKTTGYVDPKKIVIMGGSWGGYLTLMALTKTPDIWAAGVSVVPLANWFTAHANEDPTLQKNDEWLMGNPVTDRELWHDRSPLFFADQIRAPLLLVAGQHDIRCPVEETQQMAEAARKNGIPVEVKIYENEGHGLVRRENQIDEIKRTARFLETHVKQTAPQ